MYQRTSTGLEALLRGDWKQRVNHGLKGVPNALLDSASSCPACNATSNGLMISETAWSVHLYFHAL